FQAGCVPEGTVMCVKLQADASRQPLAGRAHTDRKRSRWRRHSRLNGAGRWRSDTGRGRASIWRSMAIARFSTTRSRAIGCGSPTPACRRNCAGAASPGNWCAPRSTMRGRRGCAWSRSANTRPPGWSAIQTTPTSPSKAERSRRAGMRRPTGMPQPRRPRRRRAIAARDLRNCAPLTPRPPMRLNRYISDTGHCSRREADRLIGEGRVTVNGIRARIGAEVGDDDAVLLDGQPLRQRSTARGGRRHVYIALNKPVGITCTTESSVKGNIVDFVGHEQRIFPIGRLDKDSEGLILLTSNGDIVNAILRAENKLEKEYLVAVNHPVTPEFLRGMSRGVPVHGQT